MGEPTITPNAEMEALKAENEKVKAENKRLRQQQKFGTELPEEMERSVSDRMAAGLTREQAIQVERDQLRADRLLLLRLYFDTAPSAASRAARDFRRPYELPCARIPPVGRASRGNRCRAEALSSKDRFLTFRCLPEARRTRWSA